MTNGGSAAQMPTIVRMGLATARRTVINYTDERGRKHTTVAETNASGEFVFDIYADGPPKARAFGSDPKSFYSVKR